MDTNLDLCATLLQGQIGCGNDERDIDSLPWNEHPKFAGVALKHLVTAGQTDGNLSVHLVRIEPGSAIGEHAHSREFELHEVAAGGGICRCGGREIEYRPGVCRIIAKGEPHSVTAGDKGMLLLAKFAPALC